jgi:hypothetical protein
MNNRALIKYVTESGVTVDTMPDFWHDNNIFTGDEWDRYQLEIDYKELYSEFYGDQVHGDLDKIDDDELSEMIDSLVHGIEEKELEEADDYFDELYEHYEAVYAEAEEAAELDFESRWDHNQSDFDVNSKINNILH